MNIDLSIDDNRIDDCSIEWDFERLFTSSDEYYSNLIENINSSKETIDCEVYKFASDITGKLIFEELCKASMRGIKVRIIVDGFGSSGWESSYATDSKNAGIQFKVYHPPRISFLKKLNNRTHRKLVIVDQKIAFVGSANFTDCHSAIVNKDKAWRDSSICIQGDEIKYLISAFESNWMPWKEKFTSKIFQILKELKFPSLVRLNRTWKERRRNYTILKNKIREAQNNIWISTGYFVPPRSLMRLLCNAANRGVDVRILVSSQSDIFFMPWVGDVYSYYLVSKGVKIYDYQPSVQHSKEIIIDEWMIVGSSNLNHRSIFHDQEVDILLTHSETKDQITKKFLSDIEKSKQTTMEELGNRSFILKYFAKLLLIFRTYL